MSSDDLILNIKQRLNDRKLTVVSKNTNIPYRKLNEFYTKSKMNLRLSELIKLEQYLNS